MLFYVTDDAAATTIERLIRAAGFGPLKAGGVADAGRIEAPGGEPVRPERRARRPRPSARRRRSRPTRMSVTVAAVVDVRRGERSHARLVEGVGVPDAPIVGTGPKYLSRQFDPSKPSKLCSDMYLREARVARSHR